LLRDWEWPTQAGRLCGYNARDGLIARESHNTGRDASKKEGKSGGSAWECPSIPGKLGEPAEKFQLCDGLTLILNYGLKEQI
jgi:hypothetical protein